MNASLLANRLSGNVANCTNTAPGPVLANNSLSAGNAAFIVFALVFGCMTQLPGSLVTSECNRIWRLSPFLCMAESTVIFCRLVVPIFNTLCTFSRRLLPSGSSWRLKPDERQGSYTMKMKAYAILAERFGNSRRYNFWMEIQRQEAVPAFHEITTMMEAVADLERGATLRPVIIVPMILQFIKILSIKGDGTSSEDSVIRFLGLVYFFSWLSVESLLLLVHGPKLSKEDMRIAQRILLLSVAPTRVPGPADFEATAATEQTESLLLNVIDREELPRHHVTFRRGRKSLKTMGGNPGAQFMMTLIGILAILLENFLQNLSVVINYEDFMPRWLVVGWYIWVYTFMSYIFDQMISVPLAAFADRFIGKSVGSMALCRDMIALKSMLLIVLYFTVSYSEVGVVKPSWLDWLG